MSSWLLGVVMGLIQGISEWLPISSKTQVIIASTFLFGLTFNEAYALGLFLEAGTFIAATYYFRREVWRVLRALVGRGDEEGRLLLKFLVVVTIFTALVGVPIYATVQTLTGPALGAPMMVLGCVLIGDGILITVARSRFIPAKGLRGLSFRDLIIIGIIQGLAALPGVSRSGVTVSAMLLLGIKPHDSFRLSFLALIPASVGAAALTVLRSQDLLAEAITSVGSSDIILAILVSIAIGVVFIRLLLRVAGSQRIALLTIALGILAISSGVVSLVSGVKG